MRCVSPIRLKNAKKGFLDVPCGYCGACRHNRRVDWSYRLNIEFKNASRASFITLTYSDENVPICETVDKTTGEVYRFQTLVKKDVQLFLKRLRKKQDGSGKSSIRYYSVGEYGSKTFRPHYHILLFNCSLRPDDIVRCWKLGHVHIGQVNESSIHYMTKYHVNYDKKKFKGLREPEFAQMSRRPAIGFQFLGKESKYSYDNGFVHIMNNGYRQRMPRYYREKLFDEQTREILGEVMRAEAESKESEFLEQLRKDGYDDPDLELEKRIRAASEKVLDKGRTSDKI